MGGSKGGRGVGGKVNLPPYKGLIHAEGRRIGAVQNHNEITSKTFRFDHFLIIQWVGPRPDAFEQCPTEGLNKLRLETL